MIKQQVVPEPSIPDEDDIEEEIRVMEVVDLRASIKKKHDEVDDDIEEVYEYDLDFEEASGDDEHYQARIASPLITEEKPQPNRLQMIRPASARKSSHGNVVPLAVMEVKKK